MSEKVDVTDAEVSLLVTVNDEMCLVAIEKEKYEAISLLVKASAKHLIQTHKTIDEFYDFLGIGGR